MWDPEYWGLDFYADPYWGKTMGVGAVVEESPSTVRTHGVFIRKLGGVGSDRYKIFVRRD